MRIEYTTPCPECSKMNQSGTLGFNFETSKISCTGETPHVFDSLPGDPAPYSGPENQSKDTPSTGKFTQEPSGSEREWTPEEEAALDEQMKTAPRRDFGTQVADEPIIDALVDAICVGGHEVTPERVAAAGKAATAIVNQIGEGGPRVGLGGFVSLPGGDVLCGVRISETWVSAMQAEGENQTPQRNVAEYLQEIIDMGLIAWHCSGPVAK